MSQARSQHSPFQDGFAALLHDPALLAAELMWRWCFGLAAWALAIVGTIWFLDSLEISPRDQFLISTMQPKLLQDAMQHIFHGSLGRLVLQAGAFVVGGTLLWCLASTAGRAATLTRLVAMFRDRDEDEAADLRWHFRSILILQLTRAAWSGLARVMSAVSLVLLFVFAAEHHPLRALLCLFVLGVASAFGVALNRVFSVAPMFCVRNQAGPAEALAQSVDFSARYSGRLFLPGVGFFALRLTWFAMIWFTALSAVGLLAQLSLEWVLLIVSVLALIYFAGADLLALAHLAACVSVAEDGERPTATAPPPSLDPPPPLEPLLPGAIAAG